MKPTLCVAAAAISLLSLTSCNVFSPFDSPTSDEQILSAARAKFDEGKFQEAADLYAKLSTGSLAEQAISEEIFLALTQNGAGIGDFINAFANSPSVVGLTGFAEHYFGDGLANATTRAALKAARDQANQIQANLPLRGLTRFASDMALIAEILGETAGFDGTALLEKTDIIASTSCDPNNCAADANCDKPGGAPLVNATSPLAMNGSFTGSPNTAMLYTIIVDAGDALKNDLQAGGKFTSLVSVVNNLQAFAALGGTVLAQPFGRCVRAAIAIQGDVGE